MIAGLAATLIGTCSAQTGSSGGSFVVPTSVVEGGTTTLQFDTAEAYTPRLNGSPQPEIVATPWLYESGVLTPGSRTVQAYRNGTPDSLLFEISVTALAPVVFEPDGDEVFADGEPIPWAAEVSDPAATTGVTAYLFDSTGTILLDTDTDTTPEGNEYSGELSSSGLNGTSPLVVIVRHTAAPDVAAPPVQVIVGVPGPLEIFTGAGGSALLHTWLAPEDWTLVGGAIDTWLDSSGNDNDHSAPSAGVRPAVAAAFKNGLDGVNFVGGADRLSCAAYHTPLTQPCTKIVVLQFTTVTVSIICTGLDATNRIQLGIISTPRWRMLAATGVNGTAAQPVVDTPYWLRAAFEVDAGAGTDRLFVNGSGTAEIVGDCGDASEAGGFLGALYDGTFGASLIEGEVIIVTGVPTAGQLSALDAYISSVWGAF